MADVIAQFASMQSQSWDGLRHSKVGLPCNYFAGVRGNQLFIFKFILVVLEFELRASDLLGSAVSLEPCPQP
jgi:hypothetical protein